MTGIVEHIHVDACFSKNDSCVKFIHTWHGRNTFNIPVDVRIPGEGPRRGRVVSLSEKATLVQVFSGTDSLIPNETRVRFLGKPLEVHLAPSIIGRTFTGLWCHAAAVLHGDAVLPAAQCPLRHHRRVGCVQGVPAEGLGDHHGHHDHAIGAAELPRPQ